MSKVRICIDVSDQLLRGYEEEARRRGVEAEQLLARVVEALLAEMVEREDQAPDAPFVMP